MINKIKGYKKISAAIIGLFAAILGDYYGLDKESIGHVIGILGMYLIGQGAADLGQHVNIK
jgi:hypothetical protein